MKFFKLLALLCVVLLICVNCHEQQAQHKANLYELLQISEDANSDEIKKAFRRLSIKFHPDRNAGNQEYQRMYIQIKRAYEILIDVSKRNTYDLFGEKGLNEIQKNPKPKGGDFRTEMTLPLAMFYTGGQTMYSFRRGEICKHCKGTGDQSGQLHTCSVCNGSGKMFRQVKVKDQIKKIEMKCKDCQGSGHAGKQKCPVCGGQKIVIKPRDLKYQVQKGMRQGDKILFKGQSEQGLQFYPGDVYLTLKQHPHHQFKREQNDLIVKLDVTLKEALLGFDRNIKHLDNHDVQVSGDYNIQDGQKIVIQRQGMPIRGQSDQFGNMICNVNVKFPKTYTSQQLRDIKRIFQAGKNGQQDSIGQL